MFEVKGCVGRGSGSLIVETRCEIRSTVQRKSSRREMRRGRGCSVGVAALVVTYNRKDVLRGCLAGLLTQTRALDEVIVVDNASSDGTVAMLAEELPAVRVVRMAENTGPAGGFAEGLREGLARGHDWIWVFNDDDVPTNDALEIMLDAAARLPARTGVVACGRRDGAEHRHVLGSYWRNRHRHIAFPEFAMPAVPLDIVAFSGTLIAAALVRDVGLPRADFFMMTEELEYCLRARRAGWGVFAVPRLLVTALAMGSDERPSPWRGYYQTRNHLAMCLERKSLPELFWWGITTAKLCFGALRTGDQSRERIRLRALGTWHAVRGVSGRTIQPVPKTSAAAESPGMHV
jgi:rhamnopyranosyl-N-acetylglucosaminyl-diphospho-decaprenol beta-1,3/1,4-galactofuranosyltransferase